MAPLGKGESVSTQVAECVRLVHESGLDYRLHAMGTVIEGEWDQVFGVVKRCFEKLKEDSPRITCTMKMDYRAGAEGRLDSKVASVQAKLDLPLKTIGDTTHE